MAEEQDDPTTDTNESPQEEPVSEQDPTTDPVEEKKAVAEKVRSLKYEEQEKYLGDLEPGDEGYLPLDENGYIAGPATKEKPARGQKWCRVVSPAASRPPLLQTPSGSPLSNHMNPDAESIA